MLKNYSNKFKWLKYILSSELQKISTLLYTLSQLYQATKRKKEMEMRFSGNS